MKTAFDLTSVMSTFCLFYSCKKKLGTAYVSTVKIEFEGVKLLGTWIVLVVFHIFEDVYVVERLY